MRTVDHINLVVPGIFNLPEHELDLEELATRTPVLHQVLRYGKFIRGQGQCFDELLADLLGFELSGGLPYASALNPQGAANQVLFKPVYVKADINNAFVYPIDKSETSANIIKDLGDYFKEDFDASVKADGTSLLSFKTLQRLPNNPHYLCIVGKSAAALQGRNTDFAEWNLLLNEIQMFLFQHPLNQQQMQNGQPFFNSIWVWGAGEKDNLDRSHIEWFSPDAEMNRLGQYLGCADVGHSDNSETRIIVDLSLIRALKGETDASIAELLINLETKVLDPQRSQYCKSLSLFDGQGSYMRVSPQDRWKFWKKRRQLSSLLEQ